VVVFWSGVEVRVDAESVHNDERTSELAGVVAEVVSATGTTHRESLLSRIEGAFRALPVVLKRIDSSLVADGIDIVVVSPGDDPPLVTTDRVIVVLPGRDPLEALDISTKLGLAAVVLLPD